MSSFQEWLHHNQQGPSFNKSGFWHLLENLGLDDCHHFSEMEVETFPYEQNGFVTAVSSISDPVLEEILVDIVADETSPEVFLQYLLHQSPPIHKGTFPGQLDRDFPRGNVKELPTAAIDILAFYRPFHIHGSNGGIYILLDGLVYLAKRLRLLALPDILSPQLAIKAAMGFLYSHEFFHHRMEMWCYRVEACLRDRNIYLDGKRPVYDIHFLNPKAPVWNEEGLANASGYYAGINVKAEKPQKEILKRALMQILRTSPPAYSTGQKIVEPPQASCLSTPEFDFIKEAGWEGGLLGAGQRKLAETYFEAAGGRTFPASPIIWQIFHHAFAGILRSSNVTFLIGPKSPLFSQPQCPVCGFFKYARLVPGFIGKPELRTMKDLTKEFDSGKVPQIVSGDMLMPGQPDALCLKCGKEWLADI